MRVERDRVVSTFFNKQNRYSMSGSRAKPAFHRKAKLVSHPNQTDEECVAQNEEMRMGQSHGGGGGGKSSKLFIKNMSRKMISTKLIAEIV